MLKVLVVTDGPDIKHWIAELTDRLARNSEICLQVQVREGTGSRLRRGSLVDFYLSRESRRVKSFLEKYPELQVEMQGDVYRKVTDFEFDCRFDVILALACSLDVRSCTKYARFGIWQAFVGGEWLGSSNAGVREALNRQAVSTSRLAIHKSDGSFVWKGKSQIRTDLTSPVRNRQRLELSSTSLYEDAIDFLLRGESCFTQNLRDDFDGTSIGANEIGNFEMFLYIPKLLFRFLSNNFSRDVTRQQWNIGVTEKHPIEFGIDCFPGVEWYQPSVNSFVADPFPIIVDGELFVFVEEYYYDNGIGRISVMTYDQAEGFGEPIPIIVREWHMSFPFLARFDGELYMLPEQSAAGNLELYVCKEFPLVWEKVRVLLDFPCTDAVLHYHEGTYFLFVTKAVCFNNDNHLRIYFSDEFDGEYFPHPENPVCDSIAYSRMAGSIFEHNGKLVRPAQNCEISYGGSTSFMEIEVLSRSCYREKLVKQVGRKGGDYSDRFHTINSASGLHFIDGSRQI